MDETLNIVLLGSKHDRMRQVEIADAADCVVKLFNANNANYAVLRFNNVDPGTLKVAGKLGEQFITFGGPDPIAELHEPGSGLSAAGREVQLSAAHPERESSAFRRLFARYCAGRRTGGSEAGS